METRAGVFFIALCRNSSLPGISFPGSGTPSLLHVGETEDSRACHRCCFYLLNSGASEALAHVWGYEACISHWVSTNDSGGPCTSQPQWCSRSTVCCVHKDCSHMTQHSHEHQDSIAFGAWSGTCKKFHSIGTKNNLLVQACQSEWWDAHACLV